MKCYKPLNSNNLIKFNRKRFYICIYRLCTRNSWLDIWHNSLLHCRKAFKVSHRVKSLSLLQKIRYFVGNGLQKNVIEHGTLLTYWDRQTKYLACTISERKIDKTYLGSIKGGSKKHDGSPFSWILVDHKSFIWLTDLCRFSSQL